jgi:hypothetical protein
MPEAIAAVQCQAREATAEPFNGAVGDLYSLRPHTLVA